MDEAKHSARKPAAQTLVLTTAAIFAFASNSVLCRLALIHGAADPAGFTAVRLGSGAAILWAIMKASGSRQRIGGDWGAALALLVYAGAFSFAYRSLSAGTGALLLFGAVQATMVATGLVRGERLSVSQTFGFLLALAGLVAMLVPGASAPPPVGAALMLASGVA